uniref:Zona pellucida sperm-binding protein 3 n=1 Tax=Junco hyemalis TaxID=40217 RepID=A0A8C5JGP8_JUNHY
WGLYHPRFPDFFHFHSLWIEEHFSHRIPSFYSQIPSFLPIPAHSGLRNPFSPGIPGFHSQVTPDSLIYRTLLSYDPSPGSNPTIVRSDPAVIPIECHYPRRDNVSSGSIRPTWSPFNSALASQEKLLFSLRLMNGDWSSERDFSGFPHFPFSHPFPPFGLSLGLISAVTLLSPWCDPVPGPCPHCPHSCLVDGRSDATSSAFVTPRPRQDVLRFQIDAFRFAGDPRSLIYITCHLKVTPAEQSPDAQNKACSFSKARNTWAPVEGTRDICSCCELGNCGRRPAETWNGHRYRRHDGDGEGTTGGQCGDMGALEIQGMWGHGDTGTGYMGTGGHGDCGEGVIPPLCPSLSLVPRCHL